MQKNKDKKAYLVGGGIASLASAFYLIRDGGFRGENITILEARDLVGGSLDAKKNYSGKGYIMTGHRILAKHAFECTYDLLSDIPSIKNPTISVKKEIDDFNQNVPIYARARLIRKGVVVDSYALGLSGGDKWKLFKIFIQTEKFLEGRKIDDYFDDNFFETNFWLEFSTLFAFQSWHSLAEFRRYLYRSFHALPSADRLECALSTPYSQHDSIVSPLQRWLDEKGVVIKTKTIVENFDFKFGKKKKIEGIHILSNKKRTRVAVNSEDLVLTTLGSMTTNASFGSMRSAPKKKIKRNSVSWTLWEKIAKADSSFGRPKIFDNHAKKSKWESFTITFEGKLFFQMLEKLTGNKAGTGGGITFKTSSWVMSLTTPHQPHFINQPKDVYVCWGYALRPDKVGDYVKKTMYECNGKEIVQELIGHLGFEFKQKELLSVANCIPCVLPYITSQFAPRVRGDRPEIVPICSSNFAFLGQFCEIPRDIVFTVEYSIRSAQIAVYTLLNLKKKVQPIYKGHLYPKHIYRVLKRFIG